MTDQEHTYLLEVGFVRDDDGYRRAKVFIYRSEDGWAFEVEGELFASDFGSAIEAVRESEEFLREQVDA